MHVNRRNVHMHACICYTFLVSINLFAWLLFTFRRPYIPSESLPRMWRTEEKRWVAHIYSVRLMDATEFECENLTERMNEMTRDGKRGREIVCFRYHIKWKRISYSEKHHFCRRRCVPYSFFALPFAMSFSRLEVCGCWLRSSWHNELHFSIRFTPFSSLARARSHTIYIYLFCFDFDCQQTIRYLFYSIRSNVRLCLIFWFQRQYLFCFHSQRGFLFQFLFLSFFSTSVFWQILCDTCIPANKLF